MPSKRVCRYDGLTVPIGSLLKKGLISADQANTFDEGALHRMARSQITLALVAILLSLTGLAPPARAGGTYLDEPFETPPTSWTADWYDAVIGSRNRITSIAGGVEGDGISVSIPAGSHFGSAAHWRFADNGQAEPDELYYRYFLRFPDGFDNYGTGKLPGPAGLYSSSGFNKVKPSAANPGWSARMTFATPLDDRDATHTQIGFYVYHLDQPTSSGEFFLWDENTGAIDHGAWHCVEGRVKMNTPGQPDGILEGWVDEQLAFHESDFKFRTSSQSNINVKSFWFDVFFGGADPAPGSLSMDFDSLVLSPERVGCGAASDGFVDTQASVHADSIDRLAAAGITAGCNPPTNNQFCPDDPVTRGQMAAFLTRGLELEPAATDFFNDDDGISFEADINKLAAAGITGGCNPPTRDNYCPWNTVTRGQMAAFLARALDLPETDTDFFNDDDGIVFERDINRMAAAGITSGCNPPTKDHYCAGENVTRAQMATFLTRALELPPAPPPPPDDGPTVPVVPPGYDAAVPPGWSIQAVSNTQPTGAAIYLEPGVHLRQEVEPAAGQSFSGGPGTVLDGANQGTNAFDSAAANVSISDIEIRNYDTAISVDGNDWTVSGINAHDIETGIDVTGDRTTITDSTFSDLDLNGIRAVGSAGLNISDVVIERANQNQGTLYAAGIALSATANAVIDTATVDDTHGFGIWFNDGATNTTVTNSIVTNNAMDGIRHDHAYGSTISGNTATGNGHDPSISWMIGAGILVRGPDATITGNFVENNFSGITIIDHTQVVPSGPQGSYLPTSVSVHDNTVIESGLVGAFSTGDAAVFSTGDWDGNDYFYADTADKFFRWDFTSYNFTTWQSAGLDTNGSISTP